MLCIGGLSGGVGGDDGCDCGLGLCVVYCCACCCWVLCLRLLFAVDWFTVICDWLWLVGLVGCLLIALVFNSVVHLLLHGRCLMFGCDSCLLCYIWILWFGCLCFRWFCCLFVLYCGFCAEFLVVVCCVL